MGIFNRSIPTYTVDTANKLRVTTPLPEEEPNTYVDDAFDPILNQAVRDRLLKQWGNPVSATLAGYYEMLDNAFVGSTKQWGALGPGMGVLGTFGRTMDKGGDAIIGTLTEGVKGLTGQGVESPFHNIFVKDEDYTGGKLLAAMGNSMAKMAGAPELTEEDFGGLWSVPSIGLELATDPGIMGGAMAKAGGAVGKLSTSEVLQNLGKSGRSPLADVGQLLSNYDDAMSKIALDVTAPGTRQAIEKFGNHFHQMFQQSSPENYANRLLRAKSKEEFVETLREAKADPKLVKYIDVEKAIADAKDKKFKELVKEKLHKKYTYKSAAEPEAATKVAKPVEPVEPDATKSPRHAIRKFVPNARYAKARMREDFEGYVDDIRTVSSEFTTLASVKNVKATTDAERVEAFARATEDTLPKHADEMSETYERSKQLQKDFESVAVNIRKHALHDFIRKNGFHPLNDPEIKTYDDTSLKQRRAFLDDVHDNPFKGRTDFVNFQNELAKLDDIFKYEELPFKKSPSGDVTPAYELLRYTDAAKKGNLLDRYDVSEIYRDNFGLNPAYLEDGGVPPASIKLSKYELDSKQAKHIEERLEQWKDSFETAIKGTKWEGTVKFPHVETPSIWEDTVHKPHLERIYDKRAKAHAFLKQTVALVDSAYKKFIEGKFPAVGLSTLKDSAVKSVRDVLTSDYKKLSPEEQLDFLVKHYQYFEDGTKAVTATKQNWFKAEVEKIIEALDKKYPVPIKHLQGSGRDSSGLYAHEIKAIEASSDEDVRRELTAFLRQLTDRVNEPIVVRHPITGGIVPFRDITPDVSDEPTTRFVKEFIRKGKLGDISAITELFDKSEDEAWEIIQKKHDALLHRNEYRKRAIDSLNAHTAEYNAAIDYATGFAHTFPRKNTVDVSSEPEAVSNILQKLANNPELITNAEYRLPFEPEWLEELSQAVADGVLDLETFASKDFRFISEDDIDLVKELSTVGGFLAWVERNVNNDASVNRIRRIAEPYAKAFENAPISVSPSLIYNARDVKTLTNLVAYSELELKQILNEYGYLGELTDESGLWELFNADPVIQQLFTPSYRTEQYISDLKLMLKEQGLRIPMDNERLRSNFFKFINEYPALKSALGVKDAFIKDLKKVVFGDDGLKWTWDVKQNKRIPKGTRKFTVQQQLLAMDKFTQHILNTIDPDTIRSVSKGSLPIKDLIDVYGLKAALNPELIFNRKIVQWDPVGKKWERISKYNALAEEIALPNYRDGIEFTKSAVLAYLNSDFYTELYRFAKNIQNTIFEPLRRHDPLLSVSSIDAATRLTPDIAGEVEAMGDLEYSGKGRSFAKSKGWAQAEAEARSKKELGRLTDFGYTKDVNDALRSHVFAKSIRDVKQFVTPDTLKGFKRSTYKLRWGIDRVAAKLGSLDLRDFMEVKFNNLGILTIDGSNVPGLLKDYVAKYTHTPTEMLPSRFRPIRNYISNAATSAERTMRLKALDALMNAEPNTTVSQILKDCGGVTNDIKYLFNKVDLTPHYVKDVTYNYQKSIGRKVIAENEALAELEAMNPLDLVDAEVRTYAQASAEEAFETAGVGEIAETVHQMTDGKGPEHLKPKDVETLREAYGDDAVDVFSLIHKATVSDSNAKFTKTNTYDTAYGKAVAAKSAKLMKSETAADDLRMYDMIQTLEHGDSLSYAALMDELVTSGGHVGMRVGGERLATLRTSLTDFVNTVNSQLGTSVLKLHEVAGKKGTYLGVVFDVENSKKILKSKFKTLKFKDESTVVFEAPAALPESLRKFKESEAYAANDEFAREMSNYVQGIHSKLGFNYEPTPHVKHVLSDLDAKHAPLLAEFYQDLNLDGLKELSNRLLNSDSFNHLYGTFGAVPFGRSLRGGNWRYNFDDYNTFDFTPDRVLSSSLSEGILSNTNVQSFVGLFVNDNFKLNQYFKTVEELEDVLYARLESGKMSGNLDNLDIIAPVYNESGKVIRFQRFDKMSRSSLEKALKTEDAIIVPSHIVAPLDAWCKKDAKMSNSIYRFFNRMFALPYKLGVLANPGFLLGNVSDAYLKQATTLSEKYGTSITEELVRVAESIRDVQLLNNSAAKAYDKILQFFDKEKITVLPSERPMMVMNINPKARKRVVDFLNGKVIVKGKEVDIEQFLRPEEVDSMRLWLYINSNQPTVFSKTGFRDLSKEDVQISSDDGFLSRIFYGSRHFNPNKPNTWGVFKNPATEGIFQVSESSETLFRSANVLNALKHEGYDAAGLAKILGEGYDEAAAKKLHVDTVNAMNVMYNSNFNYEAQSELMDKIGYVVPFPTFFVKNFAYWMDLLVNNPEYIDSAITIQEGLWNDRDEEVSEDRFMAEAKGRGAVPISDGDDKGLSKFFKGIYKQTPLNSMFSAFNLLNHPIENLTNRVHPLISTPMQLAQAEMGANSVGLATPEDAEDVKYRPYSFNQFERNVKYPDEEFNSLNFLFHKLNPYDRTIGNAMRFPHKMFNRDVQLSDIVPSVFQPDF